MPYYMDEPMRAFVSLPMPEGGKFLANRRHILGVQQRADGTLVVYVMNITEVFEVPAVQAPEILKAIEGNYDTRPRSPA